MEKKELTKRDLARKAMKEALKQIPVESNHALWNYAASKEHFDSDHAPYTQFRVAIVNNRETHREITRSKLIDILSEQNAGVIQIGNDVNFKVKKGPYELLFVVYDVRRNVQEFKDRLKEKGIIARQDYNLREKMVLEIVDYLKTIYKPAED